MFVKNAQSFNEIETTRSDSTVYINNNSNNNNDNNNDIS